MAVKRKKAAKRKAPGRRTAAKKAPKKKAARKRSTTKKAVRKKAPKRKAARGKAPTKQPARKKSAARKVAARKSSTRKPTKRKAAGKKAPRGKAAQERRAAAARVEAERRAAAVREQLSRARLGTFEDLFESAEPEVRTIGHQLRNLVLELIPGARETVYLRWKIALYKTSTEICGIQPAVDRCNFYLTKGAYLHDPQGILEGSGKAIRHVKVRSVVGMAAEGLRDLIKQSLEITAA